MRLDVAKVRRNILLLLLVAIVVGSLALALLAPIVANLPPDAARLGQRNYLIFGLFLAGLLLIPTYFYLAPIAQLARVLLAQGEIPPALAYRARAVAFALPVRLIYLPLVVTFLVAFASDLLAAWLLPDYDLTLHLPGSVLVVIAAASLALLLALIVRRVLRPVLLATDGLADVRTPRFSVRMRQSAVLMTVAFVVVGFLGLLGYNLIVESGRVGLRDKYQVLGESITGNLVQYLDEKSRLAYIASLAVIDEGGVFVLDGQGVLLAHSEVADEWFPDPAWFSEPTSGLRPIPGGEALLLPFPLSTDQGWLAFVYRVDVLALPFVQRAFIIFTLFALGMLGYAYLLSFYTIHDSTRDIQEITSRLHDLARGKQAAAQDMPLLALDEVGDLALAFNALQAQARLQQAQMAQEQQELRALLDMSRDLVSILDVDVLLREMLARLEATFGYRNILIYLLDAKTNELYCAAFPEHMAPEHGARRFVRGSASVIGQVAATGKSVLLADVRDCAFYESSDVRISSKLAVPILLGEEVIGVFDVESEVRNAFTERDLRILTLLANQAAIAVHNARLYRQLEERRRIAAALADLARLVNSTLDLHEVLERALEHLQQIVSYDTSSILLASGDLLTLAGGRGFADMAGLIGSTFTSDERNLGHQVMLSQRVQVIPDVQALPEWRRKRDDVEGAHIIHAWIGAPLVVQGRAIGLLTLDKYEPNFYDAEAGEQAAAFAAQIAIAVGNARLFAELNEQATEMAAMARKLTDEKRKLDAILRNIADGLLVTDRWGMIILVNPAFEGLFGRSVDSLLGHPLTAVVLQPELVALIEHALAAHDETFMAEIPLSGGRTLKASSAAIQQEAQILGAVTVLRDITHEKAVDRMKTEFISTVSHELRTPLTSVLGFAKLIERTFERYVLPQLPAEARRHPALARIQENLNIIVVEGERLTRLINDVLDIAKIEAGKVVWHEQRVELRELLETALRLVQPDAEAKGLTLTLITPPVTLPQLLADPERIVQVLGNLLSNAVKFTERGGITVTARPLAGGESIHGWVTPSTGGVLVAVQDTGVGLPLEEMPYLFQRFQQLGGDTLTAKPRGTGLGLAICKEIVEHYGGKIWAESQLGAGATFSFTLGPLARAQDEAAGGQTPPAAPAIRSRIDNAVAGSAYVAAPLLIVDDEIHIRLLLAQELQQAGYRVLQAANGKEALAMARAEHPALILLDVMMPDISGFDVVRVLKADPRTSDIPILILSIIEDRERGLALGADDYLTKPVATADLLQAVANLLAYRPVQAAIAAQDASVIEVLTAALREQNFEAVAACAPRGAWGEDAVGTFECTSLDKLLGELNAAEITKVVRFQDLEQQMTVVVLTARLAKSDWGELFE